VTADTLVLAPGERVDAFITPHAAPGSEMPIRARLVDRGYGSVEARQDEDLFTLVMADTPAPPAVALPTITRTIEPINQADAMQVFVEFGISQASNGAFRYTINDKQLGQFKPVQAKVGETQIWTIKNTTPWSHPFHLHGFFFQVLDKDGQPVRPMAWKDTRVPYKDSLKLIVVDDRPGRWMFHCPSSICRRQIDETVQVVPGKRPRAVAQTLTPAPGEAPHGHRTRREDG
jgi:FtsP/CotA-like multicopper oxidase with cupredoxin domain